MAALAALGRQGTMKPELAAEAAAGYKIDDPRAAGPQTSDGGVA